MASKQSHLLSFDTSELLKSDMDSGIEEGTILLTKPKRKRRVKNCVESFVTNAMRDHSVSGVRVIFDISTRLEGDS